MKKNGFSLIGFLVVLAIILIIAAFVIPDFYNSRFARDFKTYIGIQPSESWKNDSGARAIVQPLVLKQLNELWNEEQRECAVPSDISLVTPETTEQKVKDCERTSDDYARAYQAIHHYGFTVGDDK